LYKELFVINNALFYLVNNVDLSDKDKLDNLMEYLHWQIKQHEIYRKESEILYIPQTIFKNKISKYEYNAHKNILNKYYNKIDDNYIKKNISINYSDALHLLNNMILTPGTVVWIEFGYNVGCEFRGPHPAVILKNNSKGLIVAPLTSGIKNDNKKREIDVSKVYHFKPRNRYTDITRILMVSIYRVDLHKDIGSIHKKNLNEIKSGIVNYWQNIFRIHL
jgi:mRNA interferase MazF